MNRAPSPGASPQVSIVPAGDRRAVVDQLSQLERHDLSALMGWIPGEDGRFDVPSLDRFFTEPGHSAHLIRSDGALAGFCLTRPLEDGVQFVHSFFVVRALRRTGVGRAAAEQLLRQQPGRWAIAFLEEYAAAGHFWRGVAREVAGEHWSEGTRTSPDGEHRFAWIELAVAAD